MGPSGNLKAEYFSNLDREGFKNKINQKKKKKEEREKKRYKTFSPSYSG